MADKIEQAVVETTEGVARPTPEAGNDAPDIESLDSLLKQFDEATKDSNPESAASAAPPGKAKAEVKPADSNALAEQVRRIVDAQEAQTKAQQAEVTQKALTATVASLRADLPDDPAVNKFVMGWLKDTADNDKRLQNAFANRDRDPQTWNKIVTGLTRDCQKDFATLSRRPDAAATEDREAVTAALRGASTAPPPTKEPDLSKMSDAELRKYKQEKWGIPSSF